MMETIQDLEKDDDWTLVNGNVEPDRVLRIIGEDPDKWDNGSLFVKQNEGEYTDVVWFSGNTPHNSKPLTRIL